MKSEGPAWLRLRGKCHAALDAELDKIADDGEVVRAAITIKADSNRSPVTSSTEATRWARDGKGNLVPTSDRESFETERTILG